MKVLPIRMFPTREQTLEDAKIDGRFDKPTKTEGLSPLALLILANKELNKTKSNG